MNERIRQLALQSDATVLGTISGGKQYTFLEQDLARFVELIVEECADVMDGRDENGNAKDGDVIKEHFGVEE